MPVISIVYVVVSVAAVSYAIYNNRLLLDYCDLINGIKRKGETPDSILQKKAGILLNRLYIMLMILITLTLFSTAINK